MSNEQKPGGGSVGLHPVVGRCSVPMWRGGAPAGTCDRPAYGERPPCGTWRNAYTGEEHRLDGRYNGYVPGLACDVHGGPTRADVAHFGDPCKYCGTPHDEVAPGPCPALAPNNTIDARRRRLDADLWQVIYRHGLDRHPAAHELRALVHGAMSAVVRDVLDAVESDLRSRRFK